MTAPNRESAVLQPAVLQTDALEPAVLQAEVLRTGGARPESLQPDVLRTAALEPAALQADVFQTEADGAVPADGTPAGDMVVDNAFIDDTVDEGGEFVVISPFDNEEPLEEEDPAVIVDEDAGSPSRAQKVFKALFFVCAVFFAGELLWLFFVTPLRPLSSLVISGIDTLPLEQDDLMKKAGITARTSYMTFDTARAEKNLAAIPAVESVKAVKRFPGTARISLVPRKNIALFLVNIDGKTVPAYFDKYGVVSKIGGTKEEFLSVPVVSGLETDSITEGSRLPSVYARLFESLDRLASDSPKSYQAISEIEINKKTYDGFDITVFPSHAPVKVRMNADIDEETIGRMFVAIDVLEAKNEQVSEIDLRTETASYIVKGPAKPPVGL
jgi:cell division protein FtsQ